MSESKSSGRGNPQLGGGLGVEDGKKNMLTKIAILSRVNDRKRARDGGS